MRRQNFLPIAGLFAWLVATPMPAQAYLDGATGSIMLQTLIGAIGGAAFYARTIMAKIRSFLDRGDESTEATPE